MRDEAVETRFGEWVDTTGFQQSIEQSQLDHKQFAVTFQTDEFLNQILRLVISFIVSVLCPLHVSAGLFSGFHDLRCASTVRGTIHRGNLTNCHYVFARVSRTPHKVSVCVLATCKPEDAVDSTICTSVTFLQKYAIDSFELRRSGLTGPAT
jgi:hypothetical protein